MRINKYLAWKKYCTRLEADELVKKGCVKISGRRAVLGDKVKEEDTVEVDLPKRRYRYFAYYKPRGVITHSPQADETQISDILPIRGVFPVGRLDKDSYGLILLTDDARVTDALLNPAHAHEKEYLVSVATDLPKDFRRRMERGLDIGDYRTKPCKVQVVTRKKFSIILTEGKKRQIRRMAGVLGQNVMDLRRIRVANITLGDLKAGEYRPLEGEELKNFLTEIGL